MQDFKKCVKKIGSASPSPFLFQEAIESCETSYIVTLSSKLSGSHNSAVLGNVVAVENGSHPAHVFDSKSASAGETLIAIKIHELLSADTPKTKIINLVQQFIDNMKTYFVLENYDNLNKNGRMSKVAGSLIQFLGIKLIMGADGNGEIMLVKKCKGIKRMLDQLMELIVCSKKTYCE